MASPLSVVNEHGSQKDHDEFVEKSPDPINMVSAIFESMVDVQETIKMIYAKLSSSMNTNFGKTKTTGYWEFDNVPYTITRKDIAFHDSFRLKSDVIDFDYKQNG